MGVPYHPMEKDARLFIRLTLKQKRDFKRAAEICGLSLSSWLVSIALEHARKVLKEEK